MKIRIASRESALAVKQSNIVIDLIKDVCDAEIELITMKTTGDIILDKSLQAIGGKGLFVKELDRALIENRADLTVHSLKDMPMNISNNLPILAYIKRGIPFDALVLPQGKTELDLNLPIGSSSMRRELFLKQIYEGVDIKPVRGNVITRLKKLDDGEYSALVLASAGLKRLNLENRITRCFTDSEIIPAAGQGIIAVQGRRGEDYPFIDKINHKLTEIAGRAERAFVRELDGGCTLPIGAYATINGGEITITGLYYNDKNGKHMIDTIKGDIKNPEMVGINLAHILKKGVE